MTSSLPARPAKPPGVAYALTVPQSVLFADISLRGSTSPVIESVFGFDYWPEYMDVDNGSMSWNYGRTDPFVEKLSDGLDVGAAAARFIEAMGRTGRAVEKTTVALAGALPPPRPGPEVLTRLREYWDVYEAAMSTLFTFRNVETALLDTLEEALVASVDSEALDELQSKVIVPSEPNYFVHERLNRQRIGRLYASRDGLPESVELASPELRDAVARHVNQFGFLSIWCNIGVAPRHDQILAALAEAADAPGAAELPTLDDLAPTLRGLARLARQLTFWKTERLEILSLGDWRMYGHYAVAAKMLNCPVEVVFAMTRDELDASLESGGLPDTVEALRARAADYCLILWNREIRFYEPTARAPAEADSATGEVGTVLRGTAASRGVATGVVRLISHDVDPSERQEQLSRVGPGDVIVTPMTRPEYGVALDHASAFVTDEGGRMCHAAIIAREKKKPCVIATHEATRILQDGMAIEVDGTQGTVTILRAP